MINKNKNVNILIYKNQSKKLYKSKPDQAEFNRQMKRIAGHEFG